MGFRLRLSLVAHDEAAARQKQYDNDQAKRELAGVLRDLGYLEKRLDHTGEAVRFFGRCIDLLKDAAERDERVGRNQSFVGTCYRDRAIAHTDLKADDNARDDYIAATRFYERAAKDPELDLIPHWQVITMRELASHMANLYQPGQAVAYEDKAVEIAERNYRKKKTAETIDDLSFEYAVSSWFKLMNREPKPAKTYALKAFEIRNETWSKSEWSNRNRVTAAINLAHAYLFNDEFDEAKKVYLFVNEQHCGFGSCAVDIKTDFGVLRDLHFTHPGMCLIGKSIGDEAYAGAECEPL
jgi:tetratricopeptide (TPR) repeat protein